MTELRVSDAVCQGFPGPRIAAVVARGFGGHEPWPEVDRGLAALEKAAADGDTLPAAENGDPEQQPHPVLAGDHRVRRVRPGRRRRGRRPRRPRRHPLPPPQHPVSDPWLPGCCARRPGHVTGDVQPFPRVRGSGHIAVSGSTGRAARSGRWLRFGDAAGFASRGDAGHRRGGDAAVGPGHRPVAVLEHGVGVELAQALDQPGHQAGPPGLV